MEKYVVRIDDRSFNYNSPKGTDIFEDIEETGFYFDVLENKIEGFGELYGLEKQCKKHKKFRDTLCEFLANAWYWNKMSYEEIEFLREQTSLIDGWALGLIDSMKESIRIQEEWANIQYEEMKEKELLNECFC